LLVIQTGDGRIPWFHIGSPESFERKLEQEQIDMEVNRTNFVEVTYKKRLEDTIHIINYSTPKI